MPSWFSVLDEQARTQMEFSILDNMKKGRLNEQTKTGVMEQFGIIDETELHKLIVYLQVKNSLYLGVESAERSQSEKS